MSSFYIFKYSDLNKLEENIEENRDKYFILLEDWNTHTGNLQICPKEIMEETNLLAETRKSNYFSANQ